ncbi:hypothetical protein LTR62_005588 [Meristemomyces frigidus]|uniref:Uncharacterized protein n=1 Tax=Meristemomyces frigidus TaxID=1508187 RepID=A0AAN7YQJ1_9PEZI|nr:hypothetical protein LTR62_005588 [Meristemomyces frigidus]
MAPSRLRKTFHFPSSADSGSDPEDLDEEHQERLIHQLATSDAERNELYRRLFALVPGLGVLFFIYTALFAASMKAQHRVLAVLGATSLCVTGYVLLFMPVERPSRRKGKMALYKVERMEVAKGPVKAYLIYLNAALAGVLLLAALLSTRKEAYEEAWRLALPSIVLGLTLVVRRLLAPLDLEELQRAQYDYKGA